MTVRTPPKQGDTLSSFRELAKAVGRAASTAKEWTCRDGWPFSREAPWSAADVPLMIAWADDNLRRDHAEDLDRIERDDRHAARLEATAGFWNRIASPDHDAPLPLGDGVSNFAFPSDLPNLSPLIATPAEVALATAGPLPDEATIRRIIRTNILTRARLAGLPHYLPSWLQGEKPGEARDRMAAAVNDHVTYAAETIDKLLKPKRTKAPRRK